MRQFAAESINIADRIVRLMEAVKDDALAWTDPGMVVLQEGTAFTEAMADLADYALDAASKAELAARAEEEK